jgi:hypothetical protein
MKKVIPFLFLALFFAPHFALAQHAQHGQNTMYMRKHKKDTVHLKCVLFSSRLFYGIELGEKTLPTMVDTLVSEIQHYDSGSNITLVVVTAKDLGFRMMSGLMWDDILDSAKSHGYELCPPQIAPEMFVMSQNMSKQSAIGERIAEGKPVFIGMERIKHTDKLNRKIFKHGDHFDYVFCIRANKNTNEYELGYSATNTTSFDEDFVWNKDDYFVFMVKKG